MFGFISIGKKKSFFFHNLTVLQKEMVQSFRENEIVLYNDHGKWVQSKIIKIHYEEVPPYYTIMVYGKNNREVQTIYNKLKKIKIR